MVTANTSPPAAGRRVGRRDFLKISGAGVASAALLGAVGPSKVLAAEPEDSLKEEFRAAAKKYKVPMGLLMALAYVNTRWEMPPPEANEYEKGDLHGWGSYGIMALVQNPSADTLGEASRLTGIPEEELKTDRKANIMGGAALLAKSQGNKPSDVKSWLGAVDGRGGRGPKIKAVAGIGAGDTYAEQVLQTLRKGASGKLHSGERVLLPALRGSR